MNQVSHPNFHLALGDAADHLTFQSDDIVSRTVLVSRDAPVFEVVAVRLRRCARVSDPVEHQGEHHREATPWA